MGKEKSTIESLVTRGHIGADLGAFLSNDKEDGETMGALLGAIFSATFVANQNAKKTNVPVYVEENGKLYVIEPGGKKDFIRDIQKPTFKLPKRFKLK